MFRTSNPERATWPNRSNRRKAGKMVLQEVSVRGHESEMTRNKFEKKEVQTYISANVKKDRNQDICHLNRGLTPAPESCKFEVFTDCISFWYSSGLLCSFECLWNQRNIDRRRTYSVLWENCHLTISTSWLSFRTSRFLDQSVREYRLGLDKGYGEDHHVDAGQLGR